MSGIKNILLPTDFSPSSAGALKYAAALAGKHQAMITPLHVVTVFENVQDQDVKKATNIKSLYQNLTVNARQAMKAFLKPIRNEGIVVRSVLVSGYSVAEEILRYVVKHDIDFIVAGTLGRQPLAKMLLGSVAEKVVKSAPCPVMTVRSDAYPENFGGFRKFLVATDFSLCSQRAFKQAVSMADRSMQVHVLHIVEEVLPPVAAQNGGAAMAELSNILQGKANEEMGRFLGSVKNPRPHIISLQRTGDPVDGILAYAEEEEIDLIFLGIRGMVQQEPILIGRVPERIIRKSHCPVVVVK